MSRTHCILFLSLLSAAPLAAADWPHWRGPFYNGTTDETNLPAQFSQTENVRWAADLPGPGAGTPIVCGDRVFISSTDLSADKLVALCFDRAEGTLLWRREMGDELRRDTRSTFAAPSPVTDGKLVVFFFSNGPMAAFDYDGQPLWKRDIQQEYGEFAFQWTFSSSPLLYRGRLYLQVLQRDTPVQGRGFGDRENESYLLALDPLTGTELWRVVRPSDAVAESREAFSSPIPRESATRREILVVGGDCLTGHDPDTGTELWRWGTWNPTRIEHWRLVPSPVSSADVILACAPKGDPIYAIKAGGRGELDDDAIAWTSEDVREITSDVPTPAFADGDFFVLSKIRRQLTRVEAATGRVKWSTAMPTRVEFESSPLVADGKVYMINHAGLVVIVDADSGAVLEQIAMAERSRDPVRSSVVAAGGNLFIRTNEKLYCIGQ
jgi:outer membrane protein assembly factor BamB